MFKNLLQSLGKAMNNTININGMTITSGRNINIRNGVVTVDGKIIDVNISNNRLKIEVTGDLASVTCDGDVDCQNVHGNVDAGGAVICGDVGGKVSSGGSTQCGNVNGDVNAGGSVQCGRVSGSLTAGGSVITG